MERIVTSSEMKRCDHHAIHALHIPAIVLMENAGRSVVDEIARQFGALAGKRFIIFCGKGNNGGDGFVAARHLFNRSAEVTVILLSRPSVLQGEAKTQYTALKRIAALSSDPTSLQILEWGAREISSMLPRSDFVIDAMFGTGFDGEMKGAYKSALDWINNSTGSKVSIDIPSGLNADTGIIQGSAVKADLTVTLGWKKAGLILNDGISYSGLVKVVDISIPRASIKDSLDALYVVEESDIRSVLPVRSSQAHKHTMGKVLVLAGSTGLTGAAAMTSTAAMRAGAGAVVLGTPHSAYPVLAKKLTEVMVRPLAETADGSLSMKGLDEIRLYISWADVLVLGPGLSLHQETQELVRLLIAQTRLPIVLDADGLGAFSLHKKALAKHLSDEVILTPHIGELSRLTQIPAGTIERERIQIAKKVANEFNVTLVLKGAPTVIASNHKECFINKTGNPGMATAGAGDVLAGVMGGLWAQGMERTQAAYSAAYLHGLAGDIAKLKFGEKSLMAMDIHDHIFAAFRRIEGGIA